MSPQGPRAVGFGRGFPRVSGDEPLAKAWLKFQRRFSPRERG